MKHFWLISFFFFISFSSRAQTFKGTIQDDLGNPAFMVNMIFKDPLQDSLIVDFKLIRSGFFDFQKNFSQDQLVLEIQSSKWHTEFITFKKLNTDSIYQLEIILRPKEEILLDEIVVGVEKYPFEEKQDTVVYDVSKYVDENTRKLTDVLKKMPGIEVASSGEIRYKGKPVETITLDGDNLFGQNYIMGSKHINADVIEFIEAIENYHDNPVLKEIEPSDKVSLNLKLKKGKSSLSGSIDAALGSLGEEDIGRLLNMSALRVSSSIKLLGVFSGNNIGMNNSSSGSVKQKYSLQELRNKEFTALSGVTSDIHFPSSQMNEERFNLNDEYFSNVSSSFKLSKRTTMRVNGVFLRDKQTIDRSFSINNQIEDRVINWKNDFEGNQRLRNLDAEINLRNVRSTKALLEVDSKIWWKQSKYRADLIFNQSDTLRNLTEEDNKYLRNRLEYSYKLNPTTAIQWKTLHAINFLDQGLGFERDLGISQSDEAGLFQNYSSRKNVLQSEVALFMNRKWGKFTGKIDFESSYSAVESQLFDSEDELGLEMLGSINSIDYNRMQFGGQVSYQFTIRRFRVGFNSHSRIIQQQIMENLSLKNWANDFKLNLTMVVSKYSHVTFGVNQFYKPIAEEYLFFQPILANSRTLTMHEPSLSLQKQTGMHLLYNYHNLYDHWDFTLLGYYKLIQGGFFGQFLINPQVSIQNFQFLSLDFTNLGIQSGTRKFVPLISSTLGSSINISAQEYFNFLDDSELRTNSSQMIQWTADWESAFIFPVNFSAHQSYGRFLSQGDSESQVFQNQTFASKIGLHINLLPRLRLNPSLEYLLPDSRNTSNNFLFCDVDLTYKFTKHETSISLLARNILNTSIFQQIQVSDFSTTIFQARLQPRGIFIGASMYF